MDIYTEHMRYYIYIYIYIYICIVLYYTVHYTLYIQVCASRGAHTPIHTLVTLIQLGPPGYFIHISITTPVASALKLEKLLLYTYYRAF
jgi:hypothetical protein